MLEKNEINCQKNEIICVYNNTEEKINLLYDYNHIDSFWSDEIIKAHNEAKNNLNYIDI